MYKFLINFNYILFFIVYSMEQSNIRKKIFLIFFLSLILGIKHNLTKLSNDIYEAQNSPFGILSHVER